MRHMLMGGAAVLTLAMSLACGGGGGASLGGGYDNVGACKSYVEHFNKLECTSGIQLNPADYCPDALDMNPNDMGPFYSCLTEKSTCNGSIPDLGGQSDCKM